MIWGILSFIVPIILLAIILITNKKLQGETIVVWLTIFCSCWALAAFVNLVHYNEPKLIDVYRGKTTLEITYRDSVAVDSTVVYKIR